SKKQSNGPFGIYWGTFDPPTLAHGQIIEKSLNDLKLDKIIVVVNDNKKTGKNYKSTGKDRFVMLKSMMSSAISAYTTIISQTDIFSFSYELLKKTFPNKQIYSIIGQDSFDEYHSKYGPACFKTYDNIVVVPRETQDEKLANKIK